MSIWITLLLAFLPKILEWILSLLKGGKQIPANQLKRMNNLTYYATQIADAAPKAGCAVGGVPPDVAGPEDAVEGGIFEGWILNLLLEHFKRNGKELGLRIAKEALLPYLKEQAAKSANKFDDFGVKQLERILNDPEFVALLEGIG